MNKLKIWYKRLFFPLKIGAVYTEVNRNVNPFDTFEPREVIILDQRGKFVKIKFVQYGYVDVWTVSLFRWAFVIK